MFSDNIIERGHALNAIMTDPVMCYGIMVVGLLALCWWAKEWL